MIAPALLTALFIYWGWDTAVACNEESDDPGTTPGRAAVISTFLLLATYATVSVATIAFAGVGDEGVGLGNQENADDVFAAVGTTLRRQCAGQDRPDAAGRLDPDLRVGVDPDDDPADARTTLSMGVYKALPDSFARIHRTYRRPPPRRWPWGAVSILFYLLFTLISPNLLTALIGSVGLMIAFYYGLTGFAFAWFYRKDPDQVRP